MKHQKTKLALLILFVFGLNYSCKDTTNNFEIEESSLPSVVSVSKLNDNQVADVSKLILGTSLQSLLNIESAQVAQYEGYEQLLMVFVPYLNNEDNYHVFSFLSGVLSDFHYSLENKKSSMTLNTSLMTVNYLFDENLVADIEIGSGLTSSGRLEGCDIGGGFLDCTNAVQDQVRERVGSWGTLAFDIACAAWIVCRGSVVVGCTALAIAECARLDEASPN